jgi:hypothetical protein
MAFTKNVKLSRIKDAVFDATLNVGLGSNALANVTGYDNVAFGTSAGTNITTGSYNIGIGTSALGAVTSTNYSIGIGYYALSSLTTGPANVAIGQSALSAGVNAGYNTCVGYGAARLCVDGQTNISIGAYAHYSLTTGGNNSAVGAQALFTQVSGDRNTAVGCNALLALTTGYQNTSVGDGSAGALTTAHYTTILGQQAGQNVTTGNHNIILGAYSATGLTTGAANVIIGTNSESVATADSSIGIGYGVNITANNQCMLGSSSAPAIDFYFGAGVTSSSVFQMNIRATKITAGVTDSSASAGAISIFGSAGTGTGEGGAIKLLVAPGTTTGSTINSHVEAMRITQEGRIGIGTTGPSYRFHVKGEFASSTAVLIQNPGADGDISLGFSGGDPLFSMNVPALGTTIQLDSSSGGVSYHINKIAIGKTSASAKVDIYTSTGYDQFRLQTPYTPTSSSDTNGVDGDIAWDDDYIYVRGSTQWKRASLTAW